MLFKLLFASFCPLISSSKSKKAPVSLSSPFTQIAEAVSFTAPSQNCQSLTSTVNLRVPALTFTVSFVPVSITPVSLNTTTLATNVPILFPIMSVAVKVVEIAVRFRTFPI